MVDQPEISVIVPTFNRRKSLLRCLESLGNQSLANEKFEVIVVDDGSSDGAHAVANQTFPFLLIFLRQENLGATVARNKGAQVSNGQILVFIDDDVTITSNTLANMVDTLEDRAKTIVFGNLVQCKGSDQASEKTMETVKSYEDQSSNAGRLIAFTNCNTELLAVRKKDFYDLGMLQDPTAGRGWPNWDDVDFGYRAYLAGFKFWECSQAVGLHWDYSMDSLQASCQRSRRASRSAVLLFQKHPVLADKIPMFNDMTPINWKSDPIRLMVRKISRHPSSSGAMIFLLETLLNLFEDQDNDNVLSRSLRRWIHGAYVFRGFREGLAEFGHIPREPDVKNRQNSSQSST